MMIATRLILILTLMLSIAGGVFAQETSTAATGSSDQTATATQMTTTAEPILAVEASDEVRESLRRLLGQHPPEVARTLALEPTLLANEPFLALYPEIRDFIAKHPEVRRNPHFYLRDYEMNSEMRPRSAIEGIIEPLSVAAVFGLITFALGWLVRTVIEQKRWNHLSRRQSEVHNKILDRFGSSEELMAYIKSPAGTKFLESAPIPLHAEKAPLNAPLARIMWSIQLGVVVVVVALGLLVVGLRFQGESAQAMSALGVIALSVGLGFIASAGVSIVLSRRLGLWKEADASLADSELVR